MCLGLIQNFLDVGARQVHGLKLGADLGQANTPKRNPMTCRASVILKMRELLMVFGSAFVFGQGHNFTDGRDHGDAAFGLVLELLTPDRISKLAAAGDGMAIFAAIVVEDERGDLMRAFRRRHFFQFCESGGRWVWALRASNNGA